MIKTDYLNEILDFKQFNSIVSRLAKSIKKNAPKAEAIAFRGNSGALVGMAVCAKCKLPPLLIRKGSSHSAYKIEGAIGVKTFVIVDDFINTGGTVRTIIRNINSIFGEGECLGVFTYAQTFRDKTVSYFGEEIPTYHTAK